MNLNKVILIGRLTQDPQTKALPSGQSVTNFGLATSRFFTDKTGQKQQQTEFHNIVMFGRLAEIASQYLLKGSLTMIEGRLQTRNWQDSSGNQRYKTEIVGERMQLGPKPLGKTKPLTETNEPKPSEKISQEEIPVIEDNQEINVEDIPL